ncbi:MULTISPECIES: 4a-hydroxytetrahydrobiopterin dehydratase [Streptomyces]|uniref:Putative pterin-4-alpha-carbinolamine dehydratase n=1 Tax=Streptomyces doudnae TaxID=3075536 RepID=A0ABD5EMH1_9ACTN|nr:MULTISPECIES: 4a-hydroxytetrahydrobiopterin dehydratase [unclassified Streptomyces]MDT0435871.1 4a-hydroxytetrahydrobiopterin dehydratase [Streptomyces sp. DSM 41981]MYQ63916.1 4a-hydroxytetrahydrobiopterin dehydratase [Streptomyces sp. SID4950]SCD68189.1 pterin-4-alpha-carbinolamine dehydratase [Streptomyces sp. SolWspMP-5a-2]
MTDAPVPLTESEIDVALSTTPGWRRVENEITRTYGIRYHGGVAMIVHVADVERLIGHHADIDLRWDHIRFGITTHDAGHRLTAADFDLARRIDAIATAHGAESVEGSPEV